MNERIRCLRISRSITLFCYHCKKIVKNGDSVYSRNANSAKSKSKLYHEECAKTVNIL